MSSLTVGSFAELHKDNMLLWPQRLFDELHKDNILLWPQRLSFSMTGRQHVAMTPETIILYDRKTTCCYDHRDYHSLWQEDNMLLLPQRLSFSMTGRQHVAMTAETIILYDRKTTCCYDLRDYHSLWQEDKCLCVLGKSYTVRKAIQISAV